MVVVSWWLFDCCGISCICCAVMSFCRLAPFHHLQGCWPFVQCVLFLADGASQHQDGQESMPQAECKGQAQGAGDAATSEQGTGASQPKASPAPDLDDLADLMQGLDSRGKAVIGPDVGTHFKVALTSSTTHNISIYAQTHACLNICAYVFRVGIVLSSRAVALEQIFNTLACSKSTIFLERILLPKRGWAQG